MTRGNQIKEKRRTMEEMYKRTDDMLQERQRHDAEFRTTYQGVTITEFPLPFTEKRLTMEEMDKRMDDILQERQLQYVEFRNLKKNQ